MKYVLRYARTVVLRHPLEAESYAEAWAEAVRLEETGRLGIFEVTPFPGSEVLDITDYEWIFDVERKDE